MKFNNQENGRQQLINDQTKTNDKIDELNREIVRLTNELELRNLQNAVTETVSTILLLFFYSFSTGLYILIKLK